LFSETSGTTGRPLQTPRNSVDINWNTHNQSFAYQRLLSAGSDRVAILHPGMLSPFVEASTFALRQLQVGYVKLFPIEGICDYARIFDVLERYAITAIMTTPSLALKVLHEAARQNALGRLKVHKLLLTGELISSACVDNFKRILGAQCEVHAFVYGASETASLMYGVGDGQYQAFVDDFIFEIVGGSLQPASDGEYKVTGPLLVTWLQGGLLPIRRYDTGDLFEITVRQGRPCMFKPLGRTRQLGDKARVAQRLEAIIYDAAVPVFNYRVTLFEADRHCQIQLVAAEPGIDRQRLLVAVGEVLPEYELALTINDPTGPFLAFAAKPKLNRFIYRD
jgi:phenylacetate-CoA ligase